MVLRTSAPIRVTTGPHPKSAKIVVGDQDISQWVRGFSILGNAVDGEPVAVILYLVNVDVELLSETGLPILFERPRWWRRFLRRR